MSQPADSAAAVPSSGVMLLNLCAPEISLTAPLSDVMYLPTNASPCISSSENSEHITQFHRQHVQKFKIILCWHPLKFHVPRKISVSRVSAQVGTEFIALYEHIIPAASPWQSTQIQTAFRMQLGVGSPPATLSNLPSLTAARNAGR